MYLTIMGTFLLLLEYYKENKVLLEDSSVLFGLQVNENRFVFCGLLKFNMIW